MAIAIMLVIMCFVFAMYGVIEFYSFKELTSMYKRRVMRSSFVCSIDYIGLLRGF